MTKNIFIGLIAIVIAAGLLFYGSNDQAVVSTSESLETQLITSEVAYFKNVKGYFAEPEKPGDYPGVILIHEWWGLNEHIKNAARELASEGYSVLAVDLYNGNVATTTADAQKYRNSINQVETVENLQAALAHLRGQGADKVASFGWCFGGGKSLELAVSDVDLDATIIYYGQLSSDTTKLSNIKWPVLGIFGDKDTSISTSSVAAFDAALDSLDIDNEIYMYPGVGHAFANPSNPNHAPAETADAWEKTLSFLKRTLKP